MHVNAGAILDVVGIYVFALSGGLVAVRRNMDVVGVLALGLVTGFAGGVADAMALLERFEERLKEAKGNLLKGAVETAKLWRTDRVLRHLQAMIVAADRESMVLLSGSGEVITPEEPLLAVGSGGPYALAAAKALYRHTGLSAKEIATEALRIAAEVDLYTSGQVTVLTLGEA